MAVWPNVTENEARSLCLGCTTLPKSFLRILRLSRETPAAKGDTEMERKIIHFPSPAARQAKQAQPLRQEEQEMELTLTNPKAEPGPSSFRF